MNNIYRNFTPEEVFQIIKEDHWIGCQVDFEFDDVEIKRDMTIRHWCNASDFLPWPKWCEIMNKFYDIDVPVKEWLKVLTPEYEQRIWDLCVFISQHAQKEIIMPVKLLGKECLSSAVFLTLKKNLAKRGFDVRYLRPSTPLKDYLQKKHECWLFGEVAKLGISPFESVKVRLKEGLSFWDKFNIFNPDRYYIDTGSIKTFRDLTIKIAGQIKEYESSS